MNQHKQNVNEMQCVRGSQPTKNLKSPEESRLSPPAYAVNGLIAMSHIRFPEEQLHLFILPTMYAASHATSINRRTALCSEWQEKDVPSSEDASTVTAEQREPRYRLSILPLLLALKSLHV